MRVPLAEAGGQAVELLLRGIAGEPVPERTPLLPVELIVRDSCGGRRNPSDEGAPLTRIATDPARPVGRLDRKVFGGFVEHLGRCVYGGAVRGGLLFSPGCTSPGFVGEHDCLGPVGQVELRQDVRDVGLDRGFGDEQRAGNRGIGLPAADEPQDLEFTRGQAG